MVLWVFDGNMVGKWTNEPCNGVDEVVNHFWVLTLPPSPSFGTTYASAAPAKLYPALFDADAEKVLSQKIKHIKGAKTKSPP